MNLHDSISDVFNHQMEKVYKLSNATKCSFHDVIEFAMVRLR